MDNCNCDSFESSSVLSVDSDSVIENCSLNRIAVDLELLEIEELVIDTINGLTQSQC